MFACSHVRPTHRVLWASCPIGFHISGPLLSSACLVITEDRGCDAPRAFLQRTASCDLQSRGCVVSYEDSYHMLQRSSGSWSKAICTSSFDVQVLFLSVSLQN